MKKNIFALLLLFQVLSGTRCEQSFADDASGVERISAVSNAMVYGFFAGDFTGQFFNLFINSPMLVPGSTRYDPVGYANNQATMAAVCGGLFAVIGGVIGYNVAKNRKYQTELTAFLGADGAARPSTLFTLGGARFRLSVLELSGLVSNLAGVSGVTSPRFYGGLSTDGYLLPFITFLGWHSFIGAGFVGSPAVVWGMGPTFRVDRLALQFQIYIYLNNPNGGVLGINPMNSESSFALSYSM